MTVSSLKRGLENIRTLYKQNRIWLNKERIIIIFYRKRRNSKDNPYHSMEYQLLIKMHLHNFRKE
jgi:hypothetical protein